MSNAKYLTCAKPHTEVSKLSNPKYFYKEFTIQKYLAFGIKGRTQKFYIEIISLMMNFFWGIVDRQKTFSLISSRHHCHRSSLSSISNTPRAGFEPAQNLSSGFVEWSCAVNHWRSWFKPVKHRNDV